MLRGLPYFVNFYFVKHLHNWYLIFFFRCSIYEAERAGITILNITMKKMRLREVKSSAQGHIACGYRLEFGKEPLHLF